MKFLITDEELAAYAEGLLSDEESRELERKALATGQTDLLLTVIIANAGANSALADELWGEESGFDSWLDDTPLRCAASVDENKFKKNS